MIAQCEECGSAFLRPPESDRERCTPCVDWYGDADPEMFGMVNPPTIEADIRDNGLLIAKSFLANHDVGSFLSNGGDNVE